MALTIKAAPENDTIQLRENQLLPADASCPCCGSTDRYVVGLLQKSPEIALLDCKSCHVTSASRIPNEAALADYYRDFHNAPFSSHGHKITFDLPDKLAAHIAQVAIRHSAVCRQTRAPNILDFGGGDGAISIKLAETFLRNGATAAEVVVVDYCDESAQPSDDRITVSRTDSIAGNEIGKYELVIASASIEHVPFPREVLPPLFKALCVGGVFYARTPFMMPLLRLFRLLGVRLDLSYPAHIHDMGSSFWNTIGTRLVPEVPFEILASQPSIVETSFGDHFLRTLVAYSMKAPWRILGSRYRLVGGWEVFKMRKG